MQKFCVFILLFFSSLNGIDTVFSKAEGFVESIFVKKGDAVEVGELLVELVQPDEAWKMASLQAEIKELLVSFAELKAEVEAGEGSYKEEQAHKKENLRKKIESLEENLTLYEEDLRRNEKLFKDGLITEDLLKDSATQVEKTKSEIETSRIQLDEMNSYRSADLDALQQEISEKQSALKAYKNRQTMLKIASPFEGMVKEVFVGVGDRVYEGTPLLTIY